MVKTTLYLPEALQRTLREAARRTGRPQAELVRDALERYLHDLPSPRLLFLGIAEDGGTPARDSEDWIRAEWDRKWSR